MNGKICKLCGTGGCVSFVQIELKSVIIICYICELCKTEGYKKRIVNALFEEMTARKASGKSP